MSELLRDQGQNASKWDDKILFYVCEDRQVDTHSMERMREIMYYLPGWVYKQHNISSSELLIKDNYNQYYEFYMSLPSYDLKRIMSIYFWLHYHGGLCVTNHPNDKFDYATLSNKKFENDMLYFSSTHFSAPRMKTGGYDVTDYSIMGSSPKNIFWMNAIQLFIQYYHDNHKFINDDLNNSSKYLMYSSLLSKLSNDGNYVVTYLACQKTTHNSKDSSGKNITKKITRGSRIRIIILILFIAVVLAIIVCCFMWSIESIKIERIMKK